MKTKQLVILGGVALVLLGAGYAVSLRRESSFAAPAQSGRFCPELEARLAADAVVEVEIVSKEGRSVLRKDGERWGAVDKGGYPADVGKIKQLVVGLAQADVLAAMTKNPAGHKKLGVQAPDAPESESKRVTVKDKSGAVLADVILGGPRVSQGFGGKPSLYARRASEDQVYEISGSITVASESSGWVEREISKVESARVKRVVISHPDGGRVAAAKAAASDPNFVVEDLPAGAELMWPGVANPLASSLQYMGFDDVQKNDGFDMAGATKAEFSLFDGLVVTAKTIEKDGKTWMTLQASFDESLRAAPAGPPVPPPEGTDASKPEEPKKPELKSVEDVKKEVDELNAKWSPWVYAVPGYNAANLRKTMVDLLKKDEPKPAPGEGASGDGMPPDDALPPVKDGEQPAPPPSDAPPADKPADPPPADKPAEKPAGNEPGGG